ncbi:unnamed protein product [Closterium sp. NIES-53]
MLIALLLPLGSHGSGSRTLTLNLTPPHTPLPPHTLGPHPHSPPPSPHHPIPPAPPCPPPPPPPLPHCLLTM